MHVTSSPSREDVFERRPVPAALRKMILPAVASQLIVLIYNMADTFYVGQTNNPYMVAGTSLILPVFNITLCLAGLAGVGGGSLISRLLGQGQTDEARRVGRFSLYLGVAIAALFALIMGLFMEPILGLLGAGENTYPYARQYALCVIVAGGVPTVLSNVLSNLIRSIGRSREAGVGIILGGSAEHRTGPPLHVCPAARRPGGAGGRHRHVPFQLRGLLLLLRGPGPDGTGGGHHVPAWGGAAPAGEHRRRLRRGRPLGGDLVPL